ncbi:MAG TPA: DNA recombination protein RmuC [Parvularcula sp.]|nr:DNA recombination protein RmuC [Parvularcula sp.]
MPPIFQDPLFWALVGAGSLLCLLALAALRLSRMEERARAGARAERELTALRAEADELARARASSDAALAAAEARAGAHAIQVEKAGAAAEVLRAERDSLDRSLAALRAEARGFEREIANLKQAKEEMRLAFSENAGALMKSHSEAFKAQNREQIDALLAPLKKDIDDFKRSLGDAHVETSKQHGSLKQQIEQLAKQSAAVSKEAENLTRALKGDVQMQGAWGEMIVDTILSRLGMREGVEYTRQETFAGEDGRARTDYIVNLPTGERLIIDSKVSLVDFEAFVNETGEDARAERLSAHARSLRNHMKGLASKEYQARVGTRLDFVIMFVPIEAALGAALKADEALTLDALDSKVAIATPTTLTTQLKTVAAMWRVERQHRNAEEIAARAGALYDKFVGFAADMQAIGVRIGQLDGAYQEAMKKLSGGTGNLVRQTELLKALGATTAKALPKALLDAAGAGDHQALLQIEGPDEGEGGERPSDLVQ